MSSTTTKVDYLIVGLGIAGTCLSYQMMKRKLKIVVLDANSGLAASKVAAGMYNPITGRRMVKSWKSEILFPYLEKFYTELEGLLGTKLLYPVGVYHPFKTLGELNDWEAKTGEDKFGLFDGTVNNQPKYPQHNLDPFGGVTIPRSGFVDLAALIDGYRAYLRAHSLLVENEVKGEHLLLAEDGVCYRNYQAKKVLFCDGTASIANKFFDWLPFQPVKGEILTIRLNADFAHIINRGVFLLPLGGGKYRLGATYDWKDTSNKVTELARLELRSRLSQIIQLDYEILGQVAGIRPSTVDRRPF